VAIRVLNAVQELDQQIAPPGRVAQQRSDFGERERIDLAALGVAARGPLPAEGVAVERGDRRSTSRDVIVRIR